MTLYKRSETVRDFNGVVVSKVSVKVVMGAPYSDTAPLATLFQDAAGLVPQVNPMTADAAGQYSYWAAAGTYSELISRPGYFSTTNDAFLIGGAKGDTGPQGNAGPQGNPGPQGDPGPDIRPLLSDGASAVNGSGMVAQNDALAYAAGSVGFAIKARLLIADLASTAVGKGAALVGYLSSVTGAVATTLQEWLGRRACIFDFMTASQIADVTSNTASIDLTSVIAGAYAQKKRIHFPAGTYLANIVLTKASQSLIGDGPDLTIIKQASSATPILHVYSTVAGGQIQGAEVSGITLLGAAGTYHQNMTPSGGTGVGKGLVLEAASPYVVSTSRFSNIYIKNVATGLDIIDTAANEVYQNLFENIFTFDTTTLGLHLAGFYNVFNNVTASYCYTGTAITDDSTSSIFNQLAADGKMVFNGQDSVINGLALETIVGAGTPASSAVELNGYNFTINNAILTSIDNAKYNTGISVNNTGHHLANIMFKGASLRPNTPVALQAGSSGTISNIGIVPALAAGITKMDTTSGAAVMANWSLSGACSTLMAKHVQGPASAYATAFTPSFTGLTVVGAPAHSGSYSKIGPWVFFEMTAAAATSVQSGAGTTYFTLPVPAAKKGTLTATNSTTVASYGNGLCNTDGNGYLPTFGPVASVTVTGMYQW